MNLDELKDFVIEISEIEQSSLVGGETSLFGVEESEVTPEVNPIPVKPTTVGDGK